jgi:hypothetical protein
LTPDTIAARKRIRTGSLSLTETPPGIVTRIAR